MCKFSVIVPVYKVESVLPRCIESILNQTVTDFELILIDDGSPDRSGTICDEYAAKDPRIRVIHQKNGGVSRARNAGLDAARGEYIVFVDSDDWVDPDFLEKFNSVSADLIIAGYRIEGHGISEPVIRKYENSTLALGDIRPAFEAGILNYACTKAFSAHVIKHFHIRFDENLCLSEDTLFVIQYAINCSTARVIDAVGYHYVKYSHATLTGDGILSVEMIDKLEFANDKIYAELRKHLGEQAEASVIRRIGPLYHNILSECIYSHEYAGRFVFHLFQGFWFRKALDNADTLFTDESRKYRALLKTKSPALFWLYLQKIRRKGH